MNIESFKIALDLFNKALTAIKHVKDLLPQSPQKDAVAQTLIEAEKAFKIAEAKAAEDLGYRLCQCTWPPQIMLALKNGNLKCPLCGHEEDMSMISGI